MEDEYHKAAIMLHSGTAEQKAQAIAFIRYGEITSDHVRAVKLDEIQGHIDQINSHFSACAMRFDRAAAVTDADIDRHLELIRSVARGLEPPSTACC